MPKQTRRAFLYDHVIESQLVSDLERGNRKSKEQKKTTSADQQREIDLGGQSNTRLRLCTNFNRENIIVLIRNITAKSSNYFQKMYPLSS